MFYLVVHYWRQRHQDGPKEKKIKLSHACITEKMEVTIRKAISKDLPMLVSLLNEAFDYHMKLRNDRTLRKYMKKAKDFDKASRKWMITNIRSRKSLVLVAESGGKIAGYSITLHKKNAPIFRLARLGYISDLYLKPGYRKKGIGSRLEKESIHWLKKNKITYVSITLQANNRMAHKAYKQWGFTDARTDMHKYI